MKKYVFAFVILLVSFSNVNIFADCSSCNPDYIKYNFQGAGWVTEIYPALYKNWDISNIPALNNYRLYARTDVGGLYISDDNGMTWFSIPMHYLPNFEMSASDLCVQGLAVHPVDPDKIVAACGNELVDAAVSQYPFQNICYSLDAGKTWTRSTFINGPGIFFKGNNNISTGYEKLGGECIVFSPNFDNSIQKYPMYAGGSPVPASYTTLNPSYLYKSTNDGISWEIVPGYPTPANDNEHPYTITSIAIRENSNYICVGTTDGIFMSTNNGTNWSTVNVPYTHMNIKRIILGSYSGSIIGFCTFGNVGTVGIGKIYSSDGGVSWTCTDITGNFVYSGDATDTHFSTILFSRPTNVTPPYPTAMDENHLIAGHYGRPIRESHGTPPGNSWGGYSNNQIIFQYPENGNNNLPGHQYPYSIESYIFTGMNNLAQNPNYPQCWYSSGGANAYKSENVDIDNSGNTSFTNSRWVYTTNSISMPVTNDISFLRTKYDANRIMKTIPLMDWVMGWNYGYGNVYQSSLIYDRIQLYSTSNAGNNYITNASRCLDNPGTSNNGISYVLGGYQFDNQYNHLQAALYERDQDNTINGTYTFHPIKCSPFLTDSDTNRFITDGIMFTTVTESPDAGANRMLVVVGRNSVKTTPGTGPNTNSLGVFRSDNVQPSGTTFTACSFTGQSYQDGPSTYARYSASILPYSSAYLGNQTVNQFNLATDKKGKVFAYFENGGVFLSTDDGTTFSYRGAPWVSTPHNNFYLDEGSLKYAPNAGPNGTLFLAIKGNQLPNSLQQSGYYSRPGGLFKSADYGLTWTSLNNGEWSNTNYNADAIQLEVDASGNNLAVFGKKGSDTYRKLYISSDGGSSWTNLSNLINMPIANVRSLRTRPAPFNYELWIGTSGQGVIVYKRFGNTGLPISVTDNAFINSDYSCFQDIEVQSGASLTINNNITFYMSQGKKIKVLEGGKLNINGVTFDCLDSAQKWGGIEIEKCDSSCTIQNCTFNNTTLPIKIINDDIYAYKEKIIKNNVFNCFSSQDYVIYAENVFNMLVQGNQFNMVTGSTSNVGLEVKNSYVNNLDGITTNIDIIGNTFSNGCASMVLNSYASELTPFYVYGNTFNGTSVHYNIIGRMITGTIKNNNFAATSTENPIYFQQCNPDLFGNTIYGSGTTMILNGHSYPNLSPYKTSNTFYWFSGQNKLYSSNAGNINIIDAGIPYVNCGYNQFSKNSDQSYFHITGKLDSTVGTFYASRNAWCNSNANPVNYLYTTVNPSVLTEFSQNYSCDGIPTIQYSSSNIINKGFGINDTLLISIDNSNYNITPDDLLNSQASIYVSSAQYLDAINCYKSLINNYLESQYLSGSLYELYNCYEDLDTSSNISYRDKLYSDLKTFLNNKILSNNYSEEFIDIAYYLINMCDANMRKYQAALTGFEFIAMFHPDATMRLLASWDHAEVEELMGQSGSEKEVSAEQFREKLFVKIENAINKDSTMGIVNKMYKKRNDEVDNSYLNKKDNNTTQKGKKGATKSESRYKQDESKSLKYLIPKEKRDNMIQRAENNLRVLKNMDKERKIKKHKEEILLIAGLSSSKNKNNENESFALTYNLSQNYPNPFNPVTKINYELPKDGKVKLVIYDILGREIQSLVNNEFKQAGRYTVEFNGSQFASGVYFYRLQVEGGNKYTAVKKMVLIK